MKNGNSTIDFISYSHTSHCMSRCSVVLLLDVVLSRAVLLFQQGREVQHISIASRLVRVENSGFKNSWLGATEKINTRITLVFWHMFCLHLLGSGNITMYWLTHWRYDLTSDNLAQTIDHIIFCENNCFPLIFNAF